MWCATIGTQAVNNRPYPTVHLYMDHPECFINFLLSINPMRLSNMVHNYPDSPFLGRVSESPPWNVTSSTAHYAIRNLLESARFLGIRW